MNRKFDVYEHKLANTFDNFKGERIPTDIPKWLKNLDVKPGHKIICAKDIGSKDPKNKTDILVQIEKSAPLKISVKMSNADMFGNWYSHERMLDDFNINVFNKFSKEATKWANHQLFDSNDWENKPFVGVSVTFGRRSGQTGIDYKKICSDKDIVTLATGNPLDESDDNVANTLYVSDHLPLTLSEAFNNLQEITASNILNMLGGDFKFILRPINPQSEKSNRAKNIYTKFELDKESVPTEPVTITKMSELKKYGHFVPVLPHLKRPKLTHNFVLKELRKNNIYIPLKEELHNE